MLRELIDLCGLAGISGFEYGISKHIQEIFGLHCEDTETDPAGNVIGIIGKGREKKILIEAHLDEIGLMVKSIDQNGFVSFVCVGGVNASVLPSAEVYIHGKERIYGVIGARPPHLQSEEESKNKYKIEDMYIDTGFSKDELEGLIQIGDPVSFACEPAALLGDKLSSKSIDNRAGVLCLINCMKRLKTKNTDCEIVFLAAVQEEVGLRGAKIGAYNINPDWAIIIDVTHAITPYTKDGDIAFELGSGAAVAVGPGMHPFITGKIMESAKNIPYSLEVTPGNSGTDAWAIQTTKSGIGCALVSIPLKYMHSQVETVCMSDINAVSDIICYAVEGGIC